MLILVLSHVHTITPSQTSFSAFGYSSVLVHMVCYSCNTQVTQTDRHIAVLSPSPSMYPLLVKDGLALPCWILIVFFYLSTQLLLPYLRYKTSQMPKITRIGVSLQLLYTTCNKNNYDSFLSSLTLYIAFLSVFRHPFSFSFTVRCSSCSLSVVSLMWCLLLKNIQTSILFSSQVSVFSTLLGS